MSLRIRSLLELPQALREQVAKRLRAAAPQTKSAQELRLAQLAEERERLVLGMLHQLNGMGLGSLFVREYRFHAERHWRLDLYSPVHRLGIELHGGTSEYNRGRHLRGGPEGGFVRDREKINAAIEARIRVLEFWPAVIANGSAAAQIQRMLANPLGELLHTLKDGGT
jgi:hypothetical protein